MPRRILVAGTAGAGKTTLARRIAELTGILHVEIDDLHWGPGWTTRATFLDSVRELAARDAWITEFQYREARPLLLPRAQLIVWLDPPQLVKLGRLVRRTLSRRIRRTPLWSAGLHERPLWTILTDRDHIIRWGWRRRHTFRSLPDRLAARAPHVDLVRLRSERDVRRWLRSLSSGTPR